MTENEAIEIMKEKIRQARTILENPTVFYDTKNIEGGCETMKNSISASEMAIKALEEIQHYRAIGTVKYFKECENILNKADTDELAKIIDEWLLYQKIGTVEECREARERQIPKKPLIKSKKVKIQTGDYVYVKCPCCSEDIFSCFHYMPWNDSQKSHKHCENCGQSIDWSE